MGSTPSPCTGWTSRLVSPMGSLAGPHDLHRLACRHEGEGDGGGRLAEVLLDRGDHSPAGVVGIATDEEGRPDGAEDADGAAASMLRSGGMVLVQVADDDDRRACLLRERHELCEASAIIDTAQRYVGLRTYRKG